MDVPNYDFNWQTDYQLVERLKVPAGTQILGEATFDNSERNLNNPDPTKWVSFGEQTWDEMMIGFFHVAIPIDPQTGRAVASVLPPGSQRAFHAVVDEIFDRFDRDGDGRLTKMSCRIECAPSSCCWTRTAMGQSPPMSSEIPSARWWRWWGASTVELDRQCSGLVQAVAEGP